MTTGQIIGIIIAVAVILVLIYIFTTYNSLVKLKNKVEEAFSTMDVYLKKRWDLIPNIVSTVKGYAKHEAETLENVIYATNIPRFHVIYAGTVPPNPAELLGAEYFKRVLAAVKKVYDYIIIDTPPLGSVIDSAVIADECDGSIIVMESGAISYRFAQEVKEQLEKCDCPILGVILNKVDMSKQGYYGKYYGKHYGKYYGKYYGKDNNSKDQ